MHKQYELEYGPIVQTPPPPVIPRSRQRYTRMGSTSSFMPATTQPTQYYTPHTIGQIMHDVVQDDDSNIPAIIYARNRAHNRSKRNHSYLEELFDETPITSLVDNTTFEQRTQAAFTRKTKIEERMHAIDKEIIEIEKNHQQNIDKLQHDAQLFTSTMQQIKNLRTLELVSKYRQEHGFKKSAEDDDEVTPRPNKIIRRSHKIEKGETFLSDDIDRDLVTL